MGREDIQGRIGEITESIDSVDCVKGPDAEICRVVMKSAKLTIQTLLELHDKIDGIEKKIDERALRSERVVNH